MSLSVFESLEFRPMLITDIFTVARQAPAWLNTNAVVRGEPEFAHVTNSGERNSVSGFICRQAKAPNPGNAITVGIDTQVVAYQPASYYGATKVFELRADELSPLSALVLVALLRRAIEKFSWGYKASGQRLKRTRILVPVLVDSRGRCRPDWEGMEALGRELREKTLQSRENTMSTNINEDVELPELDFAPMLLTDVFEKVRASKAWFDRINLSTHGDRVFPFVSRSAASNGVVDFIPLQDKQPEIGNVITLGLDTQTLGYQPVSFYTSQNIQILQHEYLNQFNALVLMATIRQQLGKFSWGGNGATLKRLKATRIMVPVVTTPSGETVPDWEGMTAYGRAMRVRVENAVRAGSPSFQGMFSNA